MMIRRYLCAMIVAVGLLCACNGGQRPGDPVKEHRFDRRDTVASLYPGEENLGCDADSLENDSTVELFDQHYVGSEAPDVED